MKIRLTLRGCLGSLLLAAPPLLAAEKGDLSAAETKQDVTLKLEAAQRHDIDFDTSRYTLGVKAITPYGLLQCDYGLESGETRIDTFDDVFGISPVRNAPWRDYEADRLACGYGLKLPLLGGELSGGIGFMKQNGETTTIDEGKEIELRAQSLKGKFQRGDYITNFELVQSRFDVTYHHTSAGYDSNTSGKVRNYSITGEWGPVYGELRQLSGDKGKTFTTALFPTATFDYRQVSASLGPSFKGGVLRYIAPTYVSGSERGSFNELQLDNGFRGAIAGMQFGDTRLRLGYLSLKSEGSRDYSPVTTDLAEQRHSTSLAIELEAAEWSAKLTNNRSEHHGLITASGIYSVIVACPTAPVACSYDNYRDENEWLLSGNYRIAKGVSLKGELYQRKRNNRQYEQPVHRYTESGGVIGAAITF